MPMSVPILVIFLLFAVYSFLSLGAIFILVLDLDNLAERHTRFGRKIDVQPLVSIIVPCRNEETDICACIDSLLAQDYPLAEIIVVDGESTDGTLEKLQSYGNRIKVLSEPPRPDGWAGKNWGAYTGYLSAKGEYLLFTDADMVMKPDLLSVGMETLVGEGSDMLTLGPKMEMSTFWERIVLPLFAQFVMLLFQPQMMNRDVSDWSIANGQFMLMPRKSYERAGTHRGIAVSIVEDIALAWEFRKRKMRVRFYWAGDYLQTRMYNGPGEMREGIVRDMQASIGRGIGMYIFDVTYLAVTFLSPFAMIAYAAIAQEPVLLSIALLSLALVMLRMLIFQVGTGSHAIYTLIFPIPVGAYIYMICSAFYRSITGKSVLWKGRNYTTPGR